MLLRKQCDNEGSYFSEGGGHEIYTCAERREDGKILLYEQVGDVEKEGPHSITRKVVVDEEFIEELYNRVSS